MQLNGSSVPNVTALQYISHFLNSQLTSQITESVPSLDKVTRAVFLCRLHGIGWCNFGTPAIHCQSTMKIFVSNNFQVDVTACSQESGLWNSGTELIWHVMEHM